MKISIVTTTINYPNFLLDYAKNFREFESYNDHDITFIIVGDNKTPKLADKYVHKAAWTVEYWGPQQQKEWLEDTLTPALNEKAKIHVPENDIRRRNFGFLRSLQLGSDWTITIDDDNLPLTDNWIGEHVNEKVKYLATSKNTYVNPCRVLPNNILFPIYSRGYPYSNFYTDDLSFTLNDTSAKTVLNVGLWTKSPDVDSFTNIIYPTLQTNLEGEPFKVGLAKDNFFPIDTQNTGFSKDLSIFHCIYQEPIYGLPSHRYDDIWIGLFAQKLIHKMGDTASFGSPIVRHERNSHNYDKDLQTEFIGSVLNENMWWIVQNMEITSNSYNDGFLEIASQLEDGFKQYSYPIRKYIERVSDNMCSWVDLIEELE